jgi:hypothetical protein
MALVRPPLQQTFFNTSLVVKTTPTPLNTSLDINNLITSFIISNSTFNSAPVYFGDSNVTASSAGVFGTGIEILNGTSQKFLIEQTRQLYEIQNPVLISATKDACQTVQGDAIPIIVWKPNDIWLISAAQQTVAICFFRNVYM